jgi:cell division protein FtsI/penicillin-binding protein 2
VSGKQESETGKSVNRRRFLQSLFSGIGTSTVIEEKAEAGNSSKPQVVSFFWTNLKNGQIGFPTGTVVPAGMPGSIMKIVSAAALYESGLYTGSQTIDCHGSLRVGHENYSCLYAHGKVDLTRAIGLSCNVFFATAAQKLSPAAFVEFARRFGLNTPVDGHGADGFPDERSLKGDNIQYALGLAPDLRANALQILRVAAIVGTHGNVPAMHNTGSISEQAGQPFSLHLSAGTWRVLQQGMRLCDREGTGKNLDPSDKLQLAVKTGTAPHGKAFQSWICGYFPFSDPKYAFCLRASGGTSVERAVPEAHKWLFSAQWL